MYESLLALTPRIEGGGSRFTFAEFAGNERKTSGSYYAGFLGAVPVGIRRSIRSLKPRWRKDGSRGGTGAIGPESLRSGCGFRPFSGRAAHRLARHLARVRAQADGDSEASPLGYQTALREVIGRCLYGVDVN